jgi:hypothetical protein
MAEELALEAELEAMETALDESEPEKWTVPLPFGGGMDFVLGVEEEEEEEEEGQQEGLSRRPGGEFAAPPPPVLTHQLMDYKEVEMFEELPPSPSPSPVPVPVPETAPEPEPEVSPSKLAVYP